MSLLTAHKPLLSFSANSDRAFIAEEQSLLSAVDERKPTKTTVKPIKGRKRQRKKFLSVKIVKGHIVLCVPGYKGYQRLPTSQLLRYIPLKRLRQAAKTALKASGVRPTRTFHRHQKKDPRPEDKWHRQPALLSKRELPLGEKQISTF